MFEGGHCCYHAAEEEEEEEEEAGGMDLASVAAARSAHPGSPSWDGTAVRDEAAAAALGLTSRQASGTAGGGASGFGATTSSGKRRGDVAQTFKSFGGAVRGMAKDVASASRSQLKSLAGGSSSRLRPALVTAVAGISDGALAGRCQQSPCIRHAMHECCTAALL